MKQRLLDFLDEHLGKVLLALALAWTGWMVYADWYKPLPEALVTIPPRPVYVELDSKAKSPATTESYYLTRMDPYKTDTYVMVQKAFFKQFSPVDLDIPPVTVKRPPQVLPDAGPSLEGAEKLPRFGDELPPPSAADIPPATPPKNTAAPNAPPVQAKF